MAPPSPSPASLSQVVDALERRYPPASAEPWDAVGLVCGDPDAPVRSILWAVDPVAAVADEALALGADLIVVHHPLLLSPVHSVAATDAKGSLLHRLIRGGVALYVAHTNADVASPGVSDALAAALGLQQTRPLQALPAHPMDTVVVMVPESHVARLRAALAEAGAGTLGEYDACSFETAGIGRFRARDSARPMIGTAGDNAVPEVRLEMALPRSRRDAVRAAISAVHPYEEPAYEIHERAAYDGDTGLGRVGVLPEPTTLAALADRVAVRLPATHHGVRVLGDLERPVLSVAVCGGSGDSLLGAADAAGADAYVTADLKHHRALEHAEAGGCAVIDVAHWASEWPWLAQASGLLLADLDAEGATVESRVSDLPTDPWSAHLDSVT